MPSQFFKNLPPEEQEKLRNHALTHMKNNNELVNNPLGNFELTEQDIEQWANEKTSEQNKFNNTK